MGTFIQTAIILNATESTARATLEQAEGALGDGLSAQDCHYKEGNHGVQILLNTFYADVDELSRVLSEEARQPVMLLYIYDGDFWGYSFYDNGNNQDCFQSLPDYFGDQKEQSLAGNSALVATYFNLDEEQIKGYLLPWPEEALGADHLTAYADDQFDQGDCWQMTDFMKKLGYPYEFDAEDNKAPLVGFLPSIEEVLAQAKTYPFQDKPNYDVYTTAFLPNALEGDYIQGLLQDETSDILRFLGSERPYDALNKLSQKIDPDHPDPILHTLFAFCQYRLGDFNGSYWNLYLALDYDPNNIMLLRARSLVVAIASKRHMHIKDLSKLLSLDPKQADVYLLARAFFYFLDSGGSGTKLDAAHADLEKLIEVGFPDENDPRINSSGFTDDFKAFVADTKRKALDNSLAHRKKPIEGLSALEDVRPICQENYRVIFNFIENNDFEKAIAECDQEIANHPTDCNLYLIRAYSYTHYDSWVATPKKIGDNLNWALQYDPNNLIALRARAFMRALRLKENQAKQKIKDFSNLITLDPEYEDEYLFHRSFVYLGIEDFENCFLDLAHYAQFGKLQSANAIKTFSQLKSYISPEALEKILDEHHLHFPQD